MYTKALIRAQAQHCYALERIDDGVVLGMGQKWASVFSPVNNIICNCVAKGGKKKKEDVLNNSATEKKALAAEVRDLGPGLRYFTSLSHTASFPSFPLFHCPQVHIDPRWFPQIQDSNTRK